MLTIAPEEINYHGGNDCSGGLERGHDLQPPSNETLYWGEGDPFSFRADHVTAVAHAIYYQLAVCQYYFAFLYFSSPSSHQLLSINFSIHPPQQLQLLTKKILYPPTKLGEGAFSVVIEATKKSTGESFAVKVVTKSKLTKEDEIALKDEIQVLKELQHNHIIRLYDVFEERSYWYLVTEQMKGGELFDR